METDYVGVGKDPGGRRFRLMLKKIDILLQLFFGFQMIKEICMASLAKSGYCFVFSKGFNDPEIQVNFIVGDQKAVFPVFYQIRNS